jgi:hypothetical protein
MPAAVIKLNPEVVPLNAAENSAPQEQNSISLFEHKEFEERGRRRVLHVTEHSPQNMNSLHTMDFKDCLSSLRWNLATGVVVTFYEHHEGGGRQYQIWGSGEDADVHNNGFGDKASSWSWHRGAPPG